MHACRQTHSAHKRIAHADTQTYTCTYSHMHTYIHTYAHTHIHTYAHHIHMRNACIHNVTHIHVFVFLLICRLILASIPILYLFVTCDRTRNHAHVHLGCRALCAPYPSASFTRCQSRVPCCRRLLFGNLDLLMAAHM